jgi:Carbonic anhydrase
MLKTKRLLSITLLLVAVFAALNACAENADEALALLKEGNARFIAMNMQHPDISAERRSSAAVNKQKPFAVVLACSDSRVPVETIFDRGIGDIFVVRVAGNIAVDPSVIGSIEYAAEHLESPLLVIMGHAECGAVKAAISGPDLGGDLGEIQGTIREVVDIVKDGDPALAGDDLTSAVVRENILQAKESILSNSEDISNMAAGGKLKIVSAVYNIKTGAVEWIE